MPVAEIDDDDGEADGGFRGGDGQNDQREHLADEVAMVGAIVLTLQHKRDVKRQNISAQIGRTREEAVELVEVESGRGLS